MNTQDTLREKIERLEMYDQESSGCSVTLGEWLRRENIDIILDLILQEKKAWLERVEKWASDMGEPRYTHIEGSDFNAVHWEKEGFIPFLNRLKKELE